MAPKGGAVLDDVEPETRALIETISAGIEVAATPHRPGIRPLDGVYRTIYAISIAEAKTAAAGLQGAAT